MFVVLRLVRCFLVVRYAAEGCFSCDPGNFWKFNSVRIDGRAVRGKPLLRAKILYQMGGREGILRNDL